MNEMRLALRALAARPGFFVVCVLTLALGVASVSAIFSVVNGTLLKPLPYPDAHEIVRINRTQGQWGGPISMQALEDWLDGSEGLLETLGAFTSRTVNLSGADGDAERLAAYAVTASFWDVMQLGPATGRYFNAHEDNANERVVVLGYAFWARRYGADPGIVGRDIQLNGQSYRVVGVTPETFRYPGGTQVYIPVGRDPAAMTRGSNFLFAVGRIAPGADLAQLEAALATVNARLAAEFPESHANLGARLNLLPTLLNSGVRQPLLMMLGAAAMVLLIACANLANLLLARGSHRAHELAVRAALGAGRGQLMRVSLAEALVIAVTGGILGVGLAAVAVPGLLSLSPDIIPSHGAPGVDTLAVVVSLAATVITVMAFALWPALRSASVSGAEAMRDDGRTSAGASKARARSILVAGEVALSLTLLVGAGLLIESMRQLSNVDTGMHAGGVLTASFLVDGVPPVPGESIFEGFNRHVEHVAPQVDRIVTRVAAIPGVERVGVTDALPLSGVNNTSSNVTIVGREVADGQPGPGATWRFVNPDFAPSLGIALVAGRNLTDADFRVGGVPNSVLVNETFVRRYLADVDPVGQRMTFFDMSEKTIVGVVADTSGLGLDRDPLAEVYLHSGFTPFRQFYLSVKVAGEPTAYAESLRRAIAEVEPSVPVFEVRSMDALIGGPIRIRSFNMTLMSVFSGVAVLLAALGLYGVISYSVEQRRREIGIRLSLGAAPPRIRRLVLADGARLIFAGTVVGLVAAFALARVIASQLYGVTPTDPFVFGVVVLVLITVGLIAVIIPARTASRIAPMEALRYE
ncbi:MAG: ABC transporter permease [Gammaproteobacteria bacterium]